MEVSDKIGRSLNVSKFVIAPSLAPIDDNNSQTFVGIPKENSMNSVYPQRIAF